MSHEFVTLAHQFSVVHEAHNVRPPLPPPPPQLGIHVLKVLVFILLNEIQFTGHRYN